MVSYFLQNPQGQVLTAFICLIICGLLISYIIWQNTAKENKGEALVLISIAALTIFGNIIYFVS